MSSRWGAGDGSKARGAKENTNSCELCASLYTHTHVGEKRMATESFGLEERRPGEVTLVALKGSRRCGTLGNDPEYLVCELQQFNRPYVARWIPPTVCFLKPVATGILPNDGNNQTAPGVVLVGATAQEAFIPSTFARPQ